MPTKNHTKTKDGLSHSERPSFAMQKAMFYKLVKLYIMNKTWKEIKIQVGYEFKTALQLNALGGKYKLPIKA